MEFVDFFFRKLPIGGRKFDNVALDCIPCRMMTSTAAAIACASAPAAVDAVSSSQQITSGKLTVSRSLRSGDLVNSKPTTLAGVAALCRYVEAAPAVDPIYRRAPAGCRP